MSDGRAVSDDERGPTRSLARDGRQTPQLRSSFSVTNNSRSGGLRLYALEFRDEGSDYEEETQETAKKEATVTLRCKDADLHLASFQVEKLLSASSTLNVAVPEEGCPSPGLLPSIPLPHVHSHTMKDLFWGAYYGQVFLPVKPQRHIAAAKLLNIDMIMLNPFTGADIANICEKENMAVLKRVLQDQNTNRSGELCFRRRSIAKCIIDGGGPCCYSVGLRSLFPSVGRHSWSPTSRITLLIHNNKRALVDEEWKELVGRGLFPVKQDLVIGFVMDSSPFYAEEISAGREWRIYSDMAADKAVMHVIQVLCCRETKYFFNYPCKEECRLELFFSFKGSMTKKQREVLFRDQPSVGYICDRNEGKHFLVTENENKEMTACQRMCAIINAFTNQTDCEWVVILRFFGPEDIARFALADQLENNGVQCETELCFMRNRRALYVRGSAINAKAVLCGYEKMKSEGIPTSGGDSISSLQLKEEHEEASHRLKIMSSMMHQSSGYH